MQKRLADSGKDEYDLNSDLEPGPFPEDDFEDFNSDLRGYAEDSGTVVKDPGTNRAIIEGAGDVEKIITEVKYTPSSGAILKANLNKTTTILGSFNKDMKNIANEMGNVKSTDFGAKQGGFNVLNVPDDMYKNADQFWDEVNVKWLDEAITRGDDFVLATKPTNDVLWKIDPVSRTKTLSGFGREYQHMLDSGYVYDSLSNMMVKK